MNAQPEPQSLDNLRFDNRFVRELPADPETANHRRQVMEACYSYVLPTEVSEPQLIAYTWEVAEQLGISRQLCESDDFVQVFAGNRLLQGMQPYATCYGGHQFGNWAGQLGDGRAINLGEIITPEGKRQTLQLKGAGLTPYSRTADGLAVLRSSIREFLCSEAMHHLGVPTTRALCLMATGEEVVRDMFYDGNPKPEPGAIVCRVAPSFTRFGNFEIFAARRDKTRLQQLADYTIRVDFPHLGEPSTRVYLAWFEEICRRTIEMVIHWQRVGFVHGVINTDNMSVLGLTIDYGPYGWLEDYDPNWTPNTTDAQGRRYRYGNQPQIAMWNLLQLANAIYPLIEQAEPLEQILQASSETFEQGWHKMMLQKLGLNPLDENSDKQLINELLNVLNLVETDMTIFFRLLADLDIGMESLDNISNEELITPLSNAYYIPDDSTQTVSEQLTDWYKQRMGTWLRHYIDRSRQENIYGEARRNRMNSVNPKYVLRNYLAQIAIDKSERGDHSLVHELLELLRNPYDEQPDKEEFAEKRPDWARSRAGCSMLSCSS